MTENTLPSLIQAMLKPEFYPHPVTEPIQLEQTHVSYVLLTGEYAYKLKKPVNFGFLNFSTLELRQHFCQEELRMNQKGAPSLYLEVLPISQQEQTFTLGGETGEIVDYALKMQQFPQNALFSELFNQGLVTAELMESLGKIVAEFHQKTAVNDYIRKFGEVQQIRQAFDENYAQTEKYIGTAQKQQWFEETKAYTDDFFANRQALFEQRMQQDKIRECHGDLHLRNIARWEEQVLLFDCIEFNEPFRFVDVMYDVAYGVMDLDARQRPDLANAYLNTYVEETGDWEGLQVLPIYLNRQSYVRAKITSFLLDDPAVPESQKQIAIATAQQYYQLAWDYTQPQQGRLILVSGVSGSGKSTTARTLARKLNGIQIRSDAVRKHLGGIPLHQRGGDDLYRPEMTQKTYQRLLELGVLLAKAGYTVILDAKYDRVALRQAVIAQAVNQQIPVQIVSCVAPVEVLRDRLLHRQGDIADATADLLNAQLAAAEGFTEQELPLVITVDTTQELEPQLASL